MAAAARPDFANHAAPPWHRTAASSGITGCRCAGAASNVAAHGGHAGRQLSGGLPPHQLAVLPRRLFGLQCTYQSPTVLSACCPKVPPLVNIAFAAPAPARRPAAFPCTPASLADCPTPPGALPSTNQIPQFITITWWVPSRCGLVGWVKVAGSAVWAVCAMWPLLSCVASPQGTPLTYLPAPACPASRDDAVSSPAYRLIQAIVGGLQQRNGCPVPSTYFVTATGEPACGGRHLQLGGSNMLNCCGGSRPAWLFGCLLTPSCAPPAAAPHFCLHRYHRRGSAVAVPVGQRDRHPHRHPPGIPQRRGDCGLPRLAGQCHRHPRRENYRLQVGLRADGGVNAGCAGAQA